MLEGIYRDCRWEDGEVSCEKKEDGLEGRYSRRAREERLRREVRRAGISGES